MTFPPNFLHVLFILNVPYNDGVRGRGNEMAHHYLHEFFWVRVAKQMIHFAIVLWARRGSTWIVPARTEMKWQKTWDEGYLWSNLPSAADTSSIRSSHVWASSVIEPCPLPLLKWLLLPLPPVLSLSFNLFCSTGSIIMVLHSFTKVESWRWGGRV